MPDSCELTLLEPKAALKARCAHGTLPACTGSGILLLQDCVLEHLGPGLSETSANEQYSSHYALKPVG